MSQTVRTTDDGSVSIGPTLETLEDYEGGFAERSEAGDSSTTEQAQEEAPKLLAGKYKTVEELEKAYAEAQKALSKRAPAQEAAPAEEPEDAPAAEDEQAAETAEAREAPAVDFAALNAEYAEKGALSEDSIAKLAKAGIPEEAAGLFFAGIEAIQTLRANEVHSLAGGKEAYEALVAWGSKNLSDAERQAFDNSIDRAILEGDTAALKLLVPGIQARMRGDGPEYVASRPTGAASAVKPFATLSEQSAAINDRRYGRDRSYTLEVEKRIEISNF